MSTVDEFKNPPPSGLNYFFLHGDMMLYRDLLPIFSERPIFKAPEAERILREQYSIAAPTPVIQEIYYGLAGYDRFQELYGDLNIDQIEWKLIELPVMLPTY